MPALRLGLKWTVLLVAVVFLLTAVFIGYTTIGRGKTPSISGTNSIASLETLTLGGINQTILVRGADRSLPVLLWLHGGPGETEMRMRSYQAEWEKQFVVVNE